MATLEGVFNYIAAWIAGFFERLLPDLVLPNLQLIIQIIIILIAGYILGKLGKTVVTKIMSAVGLKRITTKTWAESIISVTGYRGTIVELIGDLVKWIIYIAFLGMIVQIIGFPGVADMFTQTAAFLPRFIAALLVIVIGFIVADFFGRVFEEAGSKILRDEMLASISGGVAKYSIAIIVIIMALSMIGIDPSSLTIMFAIILVTFMASLLIGLRDILPSYGAGISVKAGIRVGDRIRVAGHTGVVEEIGPVSIRIRNGKKSVIIPNSILIREPIEKY